MFSRGQIIPIKAKVIGVVVVLIDRGGFISKAQLMESVWPNSFVEEANIHHYISVLRRVLGDGAHWIETSHRHGYRFTAEVRRLASPGRSSGEAGPSRQGKALAAPSPQALLEGLVLAAVSSPRG